MNNADGSLWDKELTLQELFFILHKYPKKSYMDSKIMIRGIYEEDKYNNKVKDLFLPLNAAGIEICDGNIIIDIQELIYWHNKKEAEKERGELERGEL